MLIRCQGGVRDQERRPAGRARLVVLDAQPQQPGIADTEDEVLPFTTVTEP
ncbi:hypothetical protein FBY35_0456 [Streptomyces sp. SLBN-118]|uniref:hypothetical protein n=1 Tax=Streptomyces sp. SLBN-118 TaxID=2768454 RepID=UPI0011701859|nr:hypothetical protein [Streptomyces sp. SLBN-118]TQK50143.1 hypothetical protein FBY35_0456 [Streptomyces sp. SLBN-118]